MEATNSSSSRTQKAYDQEKAFWAAEALRGASALFGAFIDVKGDVLFTPGEMATIASLLGFIHAGIDQNGMLAHRGEA